MQSFVQIKRGSVNRRPAKLHGQVKRQPADFFFAVFDNDLIDAGFRGGRRAAERDRAAGLCLQTEGGKFERMRHSDGAILFGRVQVSNFRKTLTQALFKAGDGADVALVFVTADNGFDGGMAAPQIGAAQCTDSRDFHKFSS